jgi:hypothetical protein
MPVNMQLEKRLRNYYKRWNIDFTYEEELSNFKNRLIGTINKLLGDYLTKTPDIDRRFFDFFNLHKADKPRVKKAQPIAKIDRMTREALRPIQPDSYTEEGFGDTQIYKCIDTCNSAKDLAIIIQILFWVVEEIEDNEIQNIALELAREIKKLSVLTPSASFAIYKRGKQFIICPSGDDFLDRGIIDSTLSGLENHPEISESFERALKIYLRGEISDYRSLLDNLRFTLEQFLKKILKNQFPLEKQRPALRSWFRDKGLHPQIVNLYGELLQAYYQYQNDAVKHNENFSLDEIEFMIYLTGNFMRLILQIENPS